MNSFILLPVFAILLPFIASGVLVYIHYKNLSPASDEVVAFANSQQLIEEDFAEGWVHWKEMTKAPKVWIVDDDEDLALLMQDGLKKLGINAKVITETQDLHHKMCFEHADFILLDWMLSTNLTADMVMDRAIRLIDTTSRLEKEFKAHPAHVVTYSSLDKNKIHVPESQYFEHMEHLEKSIPRQEVLQRFSEIINNSMH